MSEPRDDDQPPQGSGVLNPHVVVEIPVEGGPGVFTNEEYKRAAIRSMFAVVELSDVDRSTMWRVLGPRGLQVQALAIAMLHTPGLYEAVGAMMDLLQQDAERKAKGGA
jgi:hypothetical protein